MARLSPSYQRIHFIGDSFTVGLYGTPGNTYRERLLVGLQGLNAETGTEAYVVYAGSGAKLVDQVAVARFVVRAFNHPDLIILAMGQNDFTGGISLIDFENGVNGLLDYIKDNATCPCIVVALPFQPHWPTTGASTVARQYNDILKTGAEARNFLYASRWETALTEAGRSVGADVPLNATAWDGFHPNNTGHLQLYNALWADVGVRLSGAMHRKASGRAAASGRTAASSRTAA